jgi:glyoxylase-like metal-dependent hydrolase (beta-lactamase superfamily II)
MQLSRRNVLQSTAALAGASLRASLDPAAAATDGNLKLELYTADENGFLVDSVIITGEREAILVDTQFSLSQAQRVAAAVRNSGKELTTVYITHAHPDHWFGIEVIKGAFPSARVVALPQVVADIEAVGAAKIAQWAPKLGADGPSRLTLPAPLAGNTLALEGHRIEIVGPLQGDAPNNTMLWIPRLKAAITGDVVYSGTHVWTANARKAERAAWRASLARLEALAPEIVMPGHRKPGAPLTLAAAQHTRDYLAAFDEIAAGSRTGDEIIKAMVARYPDLALKGVLELGAKVEAGEMKWD